MRLRSFREAQQFLFGYIPTQSIRLYPGALGLERMRYLLRRLGNPQEKLRVIHIAGTSGKGSTAYLASLMLKSLKLKVGLHLSPHLLDIRERVQVNNRMIPKQEFVRYLNELLPVIQETARSRFGSPTYFEILAALAFHAFCREGVDYAVMETGLGGLWDATNTVQNPSKLCLFTRIGFDHTQLLGRTLAAITRQKAGIIQPRNTVISILPKPSVRRVLDGVSRRRSAWLWTVAKGRDFSSIRVSQRQTSFSFRGETIRLGLVGGYQAENCALALAAVSFLAGRDRFPLDFRPIKKALAGAHFPARFEIRTLRKKTVILDGAHNPQKMHAFLGALREVFPGQKFSFLLAFKHGKDWRAMLKQILPLAQEIILTRFLVSNQDWVHRSEDPAHLAAFLRLHRFRNYRVIPDARAALRKSLPSSPLVITGSLYLLAEIYPSLRP